MQSPIRSRAVLIAIIALSGAVILAAMGRARAPETAATDLHLETAAAQPDEFLRLVPELTLAEPVTAKAPEPTPEAKPVATPVAETPALEATDLVAASTLPAVHASAVDVAPIEVPASTATIAGCLVFDDGTYRLKDAKGTDAPKSRSWKSGFLRKRSDTLDVVDAGSIGLPKHVGQRVEVTGTLLEREVQVHSLHRLAESCKK